MFSGQGSQHKGMGKDLFNSFKNEVVLASTILGYDLEELCLNDPRRELGKTQFTQPALYVVNALTFIQKKTSSPNNWFIGHSLGEYNALLAAGAFDFETGLRLVQKRGELMANAVTGSMAAVLGLNIDELKNKLNEGDYGSIDIANFNTPSQTVISGPKDVVDNLIKDFDNQGVFIIPLFVTSPFHSRYMKQAADDFSLFLEDFEFSTLKSPVISNVTGVPYENGQIPVLLSQQINNSVNWTDTIRYLMGQGVNDFEEVRSEILSKMVSEIRENCTPIIENEIA
ncbi:[acyl-carrier-protein] S-malonyltransferase [Flavivirga aquatica]|uniref:Malonyl CoA-acyl carrier protein transacylase n=2 Tax=Flavivirga aquatica TaxID=1849968 RepID=A0A1E5TDC1_9FLAO|nr:[acyl-carrier-protein] S-malonyltransferase [Flavivirga aquatica]